MSETVTHTRFIIIEIPRQDFPAESPKEDSYRKRNGDFSKDLNKAFLYKREPKNLPTWCKAIKRTFVSRAALKNIRMVAGNEKYIKKIADLGCFRDWVAIGWIPIGEYRHLEEVPIEIPIVIDRPNL